MRTCVSDDRRGSLAAAEDRAAARRPRRAVRGGHRDRGRHRGQDGRDADARARRVRAAPRVLARLPADASATSPTRVPGPGRLVRGRSGRSTACRREHVVVAHRIRREVALRASGSRELDTATSSTRYGRWAGCCGPASRSSIRTSPTNMLRRVAERESTCELLRELRFRSGCSCRCACHGGSLGVMTLVTAESRRRLDGGRPRAGGAARPACRRRGRERTPAHDALRTSPRRFSRACCRTSCRTIPGWDVAALYRPAGAEQTNRRRRRLLRRVRDGRRLVCADRRRHGQGRRTRQR